MNDKKNNFPSHDIDFRESSVQDKEVIYDCHQGMTLRHYFAAEAMKGLLSNSIDIHPDIIARKALNNADALLDKLEKTNK